MKLKELVKIRTGKLDANASNEDGKYPFFTCSKIPLKIKNYSYNCECVLVAGNGDLNVKYYNGKFDAYQRTYIIETIDSSKLNTRFLFHFMSLYVNELKNQSIGSAIKFIKLGNLQNANIPLYSLEKQLKINSELDNYIRTIEMKQTELNLLNNLIKSRFIEMFGDIDENVKGWTIGKIQDIAKCVAGATPSTAKPEYWENGTIPWLSSGEVNKYRIYETDSKITQLGYNNASTKLVPAHTVVLAMAGQGKTRGTAAITEIELCTNQSICSLVTNEKMNSEFLLFYLKSQYEQLRAASNGAEGRGGLNLKIIGNFPIIIPNIELQNEFAYFVEQIDKSKFIVQQQIKDLQELLDKKMDEYFGE